MRIFTETEVRFYLFLSEDDEIDLRQSRHPHSEENFSCNPHPYTVQYVHYSHTRRYRHLCRLSANSIRFHPQRLKLAPLLLGHTTYRPGSATAAFLVVVSHAYLAAFARTRVRVYVKASARWCPEVWRSAQQIGVEYRALASMSLIFPCKSHLRQTYAAILPCSKSTLQSSMIV